MSLHKFAEQVAANGRGDDSLLVHMTPDEVRNLQKFAEANGTTLTINPETGLPEAGLLSDLFKSIAPIALGAFLGPAGFGLSSMMAGVATGGITALATGSLSRGLMAGLGAYGGAGLGESLMGVGGNALVAGGAPIGAENLAGGVNAAGNAISVPPIEQVNPSNFNLSAADKFSAGAKAVTATPGAALDFAKGNLGNIAAAASPIMAGAMVPTTTQLPTAKSDNYIRQFDYNINPDTGKPDPLYGMRAMTPVKASEFGNKTFEGQRELFRQQNPNPYDIGVASLNQPPQQQPARMNTGGIVALADGGFTQDQINAALAAELGARGGTSQADLTSYAKSKYGLSDAQINAAYDTIPGFNAQGKYDAADYMATSKPGQVSPQMVVDAAAAANPYSAQNMANVDITRPGAYVQDPSTGQYVALTPGTAGYNINNPMALQSYGEIASRGVADSSLTAFNQIATPEQKAKAADLWTKEKARLDALDAAKKPTGLANLNQNQNLLVNQDQNKNLNAGLAGLIPADASYTNRFFAERGLGFDPIDKSIDNFLATYKTQLASMTPEQQTKAMTDALAKERMNEADVIKATGMTIAQLVQQKRADGSIIVAGDLKDVPVGAVPGGVSGGGNTVINANGTITTKPDFGLTMNEVRDTYTKGGGSLGYTAKAPATIEEFNQLYNKQTGDSLAAYDYLMGKGAGTSSAAKYPVKSGVPQIAVPYGEFVLGKKAAKPVTKTTTTTVKGVPGKPQSYFDEKAYLAAHPDVEAELKTGKSISGQPVQFTSGYEHWLRYGQPAGWAFSGDYDGYKTAAAVAANEASVTQQGGDGNATTPGPDSASPANDAPGTTTARNGGMMGYSIGGGLGSLGSYSDGGRLLKGPGDGVSDSIPATIGSKNQPARLADGEFVVPARIVSELGNGSTDAGAKKLYAMMDRVQRARGKTTGKNKVAANSRSDKYLPA